MFRSDQSGIQGQGARGRGSGGRGQNMEFEVKKRGLDSQAPCVNFPKKKPLVFKGLMRCIDLSEI